MWQADHTYQSSSLGPLNRLCEKLCMRVGGGSGLSWACSDVMSLSYPQVSHGPCPQLGL